MKLRGVSFRHAVELLKTDSSLAAGVVGETPIKSTVRSLPPPITFDADDQALNQTVDYYHQTYSPHRKRWRIWRRVASIILN